MTSSVLNNGAEKFTEMQEFRVLLDLNKFIKCFTGCETSYEAEEWLETVQGLANLNWWPFGF